MDENKNTTQTNSSVPDKKTSGTSPQPSIYPTPAKRTIKRPPPKSNTLAIWLAMPVVFLVGILAGWILRGQVVPAKAIAAAPANSQVTIPENVKRYDVPNDNDPAIGSENAPITIVEFSDYQCPYCIKWHQEVYAKLMKAYEGKIRFIYRDFPLYSMHPEAEPAAEAANCAGEQSAYWPFHEALFKQKAGLSSKAYIQYATDLSLNIEQFNQCLSDHRFKDEVDADFKFASNLGVSSTPTFFINGLVVVGAQPFEVFQQVIDKELARMTP
jgi:protein-disulfide isomerase